MIDPEIIHGLARINGEALPDCQKKLVPAYNIARKLDLKEQVILDPAKDKKNRIVKKGILKDVTLFPILPPSSQAKVANSLLIASRNALAQVRNILASYTAKVEQVRRLRTQWLSGTFTPLQRRLKQIRRSISVK